MFTSRFFQLSALASACVLAVASSSASAVEVKADGFGSMYAGKAFQSSLLPQGFSNSAFDFQHFSSIGSDVSVKLDNQFSVAAEFMATGESAPLSNFSNFVQWAYANWTPIDGLSIKVGRQRYPIWTASEYVNIHAQLPYRTIPQIVYKMAPFSTFDGASVGYGFNLGFAKMNASVFGGTPILDYAPITGLTTSFTDMYGARINLEGDGWKARVQASRVDMHVDMTGLGLSYYRATSEIYSIGYRYDKNDIVSWGEYMIERGQSTNTIPALPGNFAGGKMLDNSNGGYLLLGYHLGKWMPRYTFAVADQKTGFDNNTTMEHNVGVNYKFSDIVTAKLDYEYYHVNTPGVPASGLTIPANSTAQQGSAAYVGIDFYF